MSAPIHQRPSGAATSRSRARPDPLAEAAPHEGPLFDLAADAFCRLMVLATRIAWRVQRGAVSGAPPAAGSYVLVANHASHADGLILDNLMLRRFGRRVRFLANLKVRGNPLWHLLLRARRAVVVDYAHSRRAAVALLRLLERRAPGEELILGIFPEGTRSRDGGPNPPSRGAAWVARRAGVPLVPVAIAGTYQLWPAQRRFPRLTRLAPGALAVRFLPPIDPADYPDDDALIEEAMRRIYAALEELNAAVPSRDMRVTALR